MSRLDSYGERLARKIARTSSRRGLLTMIGASITGTALIPLLPVSRAFAGTPREGDEQIPRQSSATPQDPGDQTQCDYWRYCAIDGFLCSCCGGGPNVCPPGTEMSPITWIGTCRNPADGRSYIISYNDCCGKSNCGRCMCERSEGDRPMVRPQSNNDINWCLGTSVGSVYNCSTAIILGTTLEH